MVSRALCLHRLHVFAGEGSLWNEPFQEALEKPSVMPMDAEERVEAINHLADSFVRAATDTFNSIMGELHLPAAERSLKPVDIGGVAGGVKYLHRGQFFKV